MFWGYGVWGLRGQELNARVQVIYDKMPVSVNYRIFQDLQNQLSAFLNTRKWGNDLFQQYEKVQCTFILDLLRYEGDNIYIAQLTLQSKRPVYNATYEVNVLDIIDKEVAFRYDPNQSVYFNDARVQGNGDPYSSNLSALFAFYAYFILGLDYSTFSMKDGYAFFQKAYNIVNNAPEAQGIAGWSGFKSRRNRYWMIDMFVNPMYNKVYEAYYQFYRGGMDNLYKKDKKFYKTILESLEMLVDIMTANPQNLLLYTIFIQGKMQIMIDLFRSASKQDKEDFLALIKKIDRSNYLEYERALR